MLSQITLAMLVIFSNVDKDERDYEICTRFIKCPHDDNPGLKDLSKKEREEALNCRIGRHLKCSQPEKDNE